MLATPLCDRLGIQLPIVQAPIGSAEEARRVVEAGVDVAVAQGWEAGGHVWGQVATMALVPAVVDAVQPVR